jgi:hypothetical protein
MMELIDHRQTLDEGHGCTADLTLIDGRVQKATDPEIRCLRTESQLCFVYEVGSL